MGEAGQLPEAGQAPEPVPEAGQVPEPGLAAVDGEEQGMDLTTYKLKVKRFCPANY